MREQKPKLREAQDEQPPLLAQQSPSELAEYLAGSQAKSFSRLSRIELEEIRIPGKCSSQKHQCHLHGLTPHQRVRSSMHPHGVLKGLSTRCLISLPKVRLSQKGGDVGFNVPTFSCSRPSTSPFTKAKGKWGANSHLCRRFCPASC